ncbi:MAG: HD domain-containing protein [Nitrososphaerota archaeon]|nr:HD domain-containing protein [Candidatus Bathyarchaeota archaeon]MDW8048651.1 HD domain-containing protein [Nitrososphaerota archaeon]
MKTRKYWGEIKDPIYGYIYITEDEKEIIDSYPFQRLRRIRQLAGAEFVYPGANHTRFEHSLGVLCLADRLTSNPRISQLISEDETRTVRIASMLHDIGHGPFSHVFEHLLTKFLGKTHEDMTSWIILNSEIGEILSKLGYDAKDISMLSVGLLNRPGKTYIDQIIRSAVDVDKLDFVVRDTYHTGAEYGYVDVARLVDTMDVTDGNLTVDIGALSALESFILARIESFKSIYFHRVGRAVQIMLASALELAKDELGLTDFSSPEEYLSLDDYVLWTKLKENEKSREIIERLERRRLIKCVYDPPPFYLKDRIVPSIFNVEGIRNIMRDEIAEEAGVDPEKVIIDVPTLPSVPYHNAFPMEPMEIPISNTTRDGKKFVCRLSELSGIFDVLKGFMNIIRVYTEKECMEKVQKAAEKLFGSLPFSAKISY